MKMKKTLYFVFLMLIIVDYSYSQCYHMVWSDEFDYSGLPDSNKWNYVIWPAGRVNNELQAYTDREKNIRVEDGKLIIQAHHEDTTIQGVASHYTSGRINSSLKGDWVNGRIEALAKLPAGQGTWPAIWSYPTDGFYGGWPNSGEIDIMEYVGCDPGIIHGTIHTGAYNHTLGTQKGDSYTGNVESEFHLYAIEWDQQKIDFYFDSIKYFTFINENKTYAQWPFDKRFHLILNLAIGGDWGGYCGPVDNNIFPVQLEVEYVRVYQKAEYIKIEGDTVVVQSQAGIQYSMPYIEGAEYEWAFPDGAVINGNPDSNIVVVDWGCADGPVNCIMYTPCDTNTFTLDVQFEEIKIDGNVFAADSLDNMVFYIPELSNSTYLWEVPEGAVIKSGQGTNNIVVKWGEGADTVKLTIDNTCGTMNIIKYLRYYGQYPYPDPGVPHAVPGIINAVEYDYGGEGVAYHDSEADNQGDNWGGTGPRLDEGVDTEFNDQGKPNVGWIDDGEWLEYTINAPDTTVFMAVRVATNNTSGGPFKVLINDEDRTGDITVSSTGGWASFTDLMVGEVHLYPADTMLKLDFVNGGFNVSQVIFIERDYESPSTPADLVATLIKYTYVNIGWSASSDNVGVAGYIVYVDGEENQRVAGTSAKVSNLNYGTTYLIEVAAYDGQNNISGKTELSVTTLEAPDNVDDNLLKEYTIYPNPVSTFLYVESEVAIKKLVVSGLTGQTLYEANIGSNKHRLNMESYENGLYIITLTDINGVSVRKKIIKF
jgi:beta-glucanase (GH16 family)